MNHPKFELNKTRDGLYYFKLTDKVGQIIATSEMYTTKSAAKNDILFVREHAPEAEVEDMTEHTL